jgi:hypothetical protein
VFGGFLVLTGLRMAWQKEREVRLEDKFAFRVLARLIPATNEQSASVSSPAMPPSGSFARLSIWPGREVAKK